MRPSRHTPLIVLALAVGLSLGLGPLLAGRSDVARGTSAAGRRGPQAPVVDVHVHLARGGTAELQALMQRHGIRHVVNLSGGHPLGELADQLADANQAGHITVFASLAYEQARRPGYGQRMAELLRRSHAMGARGLKIAKALGLGLRSADGALIAVDDPGLDPVFETAGDLGMPVAIHSGDPEAFWQPVDPNNERFDELSAHPGWALHGRDVPSFNDILAALERRIARHPGTEFIAVHFGNDAEHPEHVARLLRTYPNLNIDTAARIPEIGRHSAAQMRAFFIEFQDRILFGSDLGVGPPGTPLFLGSAGPNPPTDAERELFFSATRRYFETRDVRFAHPTPIQGNWTIDGIGLPPVVLEKVYRKNAERLLRLHDLGAASGRNRL